MGVRHLETFMKKDVPGGFVELSVIEECRKYQKNHNGEKPTLVLDLPSMTSLLNRNSAEMLYGGRSGTYLKMLEKLFQLLSNEAKLVFFSEGPVVATKYDAWIRRQDDRYHKYLGVIGLIKAGMPVDEIVESSRTSQIASISVHSKCIKRLANAYGTVTVTVAKDCDREIAKYASQNPSVLAVLADDTDFLIFPGHWRYFSIIELNVETLITMEFSRTALRRFLRLDDFQLSILSTIAGNEVIKYDEVRSVHQETFTNQTSIKFPAMAKMIRYEVSKDSYDDILYNLADFLFHDCSASSVERIQKSFNLYNVKFDPIDHNLHGNQDKDDDDDTEESKLLQFCRNNSVTNVYTTLRGFPKYLAFIYHDFQRNDWPDLGVVMQEIYKRQIGVILKHRQLDPEQPEVSCEIFTKQSHSEGYRQYFVTPSYPDYVIPPVIQLLDRTGFPELDEIRFKLMKWSISDSLLNVNLSEIPSEYLRNVLSLYLMVQSKFISVEEADLILLTVKNVALDTIPDVLDYPPVMNERAFKIVFLFFTIFSEVGRSLKTVGLSHLCNPFNFDGVFFHKTYLEFKDSGIGPVPLLRDIEQYRIYKDF